MWSINLRGRILQGFALFTFVQFFLMIAIAIYSYHLGEDSSLARVIQSTSTIHEFSENEESAGLLPPKLFDYPLGVHELSGADNPKLSGTELHAYLFQEKGTTRARILQLDEQDDVLSLAKVYGLFAVLATVLLTGFGGWAAYTIANRLSKPMEELADKLKLSDAMDGSVGYASTDQTVEIALVATALDDAINRVKETREREVTLSRNISHELRTPLTVIRTALDTGNNNSVLPSEIALNSARRASAEMELLTSACLELARNSKQYGNNNPTNIVATVKQIIKESLHLLDEKNVELDLKFESQQIIFSASEALVRLVVGNVIRNGFIHSADGDIQIELNSTHLLMKNPIAPMDSENASGIQTENRQNFGFGLSIMGQACNRLGWTYDINRSNSGVDQEKHVAVTVYFAGI